MGRPHTGNEKARQPGPITPEQRVARRQVARRRRQRRRRGALLGFAALVVIAIAGALTIGSGGPASHAQRLAVRQTARGAAKPAPRLTFLPRGGRTILPGHLVVAYYGIVGTMNILGQTGNPQADAAGVERTARAYSRHHLRVLPAFELVTTIASPDPGPWGTYSTPIDPALLARYQRVAHQHRLLLILDFQPGRGEFLPEVRRYRRILLDPGVGVALDPEWKLTADEVPDQVIGSASAASINDVSAYLSQLTIRHRLPQKLFIVHEFRLSELPDRELIRFRPGLAMVLQMDGLGPVAVKLDSYHQVMTHSRGFSPGFKVFLRRSDDPVLLTPEQVLRLHPRPRYISYQ
jgi:hypothetical protein